MTQPNQQSYMYEGLNLPRMLDVRLDVAACVYNPRIRRSTNRRILDASAQGGEWRKLYVGVCKDVQSESVTLAPAQPCQEPRASDLWGWQSLPWLQGAFADY